MNLDRHTCIQFVTRIVWHVIFNGLPFTQSQCLNLISICFSVLFIFFRSKEYDTIAARFAWFQHSGARSAGISAFSWNHVIYLCTTTKQNLECNRNANELGASTSSNMILRPFHKRSKRSERKIGRNSLPPSSLREICAKSPTHAIACHPILMIISKDDGGDVRRCEWLLLLFIQRKQIYFFFCSSAIQRGARE